MNKLQRIAGHVWASPVSLIGLAYAWSFNTLGWYDFLGRIDDAFVFRAGRKSPDWLKKLWKKWDGHAVGGVIVMNCDPTTNPKQFAHEMVHVRQCMRLGVFQPIMYGLCWLAIKLGCESSDPYWSNPFEIDARRSVGQVVDVESALKKRANQ